MQAKMEREKTLDLLLSFSPFHRISHLFHNHSFFFVCFFQTKTPNLHELVLPHAQILVGLLPTEPSLHFPWGRVFPGVELPRGTAACSSGAAPHNGSGNLIPHSPPPPQRFCTGKDQNTGANMPIFHHFGSFFEQGKEENITLTPEWLQDATDISQCCSQPFFPAPSSWFQSRSHVSAALWGPQEVLTYQFFSTSSNTKG